MRLSIGDKENIGKNWNGKEHYVLRTKEGYEIHEVDCKDKPVWNETFSSKKVAIKWFNETQKVF